MHFGLLRKDGSSSVMSLVAKGLILRVIETFLSDHYLTYEKQKAQNNVFFLLMLTFLIQPLTGTFLSLCSGTMCFHSSIDPIVKAARLPL